MKAKVYACEKNEFKDKNDSSKLVTMYKVTLLTEKGICEVWATEPYQRNEDVTLTIDIGRNYKPIVKVI